MGGGKGGAPPPPGEHDAREKEKESMEEVDPSYATRQRGIVARANYLAADKPDIAHTVKERWRGMAKPTKLHSHMLKRLCRDVVDSGRTFLRHGWRGHELEITG